MGRTWKREPDQDDFDDLIPIDDADEDDPLDWMTRPNEARRESIVRRGRPAAGRGTHRGLPDDWHDFDYGGDAAETWR